jgi:hypothetical protein
MNILLYLIIIIIGAIIGARCSIKPSLMKHLSLLQNFSLFFLLMIMGVKIGLDKDTINSFGLIGSQAVLLAILSVLFSIAGVRLVSKSLMREKGRVGHDI